MDDSDEQARNLDLARAYVDLGDIEAARFMLGELAELGNAEAILLMQTLPAEHVPAFALPQGLDPEIWQKACKGEPAAADQVIDAYYGAGDFAAVLFWFNQTEGKSRRESLPCSTCFERNSTFSLRRRAL